MASDADRNIGRKLALFGWPDVVNKIHKRHKKRPLRDIIDFCLKCPVYFLKLNMCPDQGAPVLAVSVISEYVSRFKADGEVYLLLSQDGGCEEGSYAHKNQELPGEWKTPRSDRIQVVSPLI
jgi:hypothetical protein